MPICQFTITAADNIAFTQSPPPSYSLSNSITVYKQCNLAGQYKAKVVSINYVDFLPIPNPAFPEANLEYYITVDSNTWRFPTSGKRGITFSNRPYYCQMFPSAVAPSFEIMNSGAQMDLILSVQLINTNGTPVDYNTNPTGYNWIGINFSHMILTLDLEKVPEMV